MRRYSSILLESVIMCELLWILHAHFALCYAVIVVHLITSVLEGVILLHEIGTHFGPLMCIKTQTDELYLEWHLHENKLSECLCRSEACLQDDRVISVSWTISLIVISWKQNPQGGKERLERGRMGFSALAVTSESVAEKQRRRAVRAAWNENARSLPINTQRNRQLCVISRMKCPGFLYESFRRNRAWRQPVFS